jgi:hypothetical protein
MEHYVGLDESLKLTAICIVDQTGKIQREGVVHSDPEATSAMKAKLGSRPAGWMGPYLTQTKVTLDLLREEGYEYVMDWPADDQPFWMRTRAGAILSVPYSIEVNDSPVMVFRQQSAVDFERMIVDQFDEMLLQSSKWPLVFTIVLHPFIIGQPFRLRALRRALAHISSCRDEVWITTTGKVASHGTDAAWDRAHRAAQGPLEAEAMVSNRDTGFVSPRAVRGDRGRYLQLRAAWPANPAKNVHGLLASSAMQVP